MSENRKVKTVIFFLANLVLTYLFLFFKFLRNYCFYYRFLSHTENKSILHTDILTQPEKGLYI